MHNCIENDNVEENVQSASRHLSVDLNEAWREHVGMESRRRFHVNGKNKSARACGLSGRRH